MSTHGANGTVISGAGVMNLGAQSSAMYTFPSYQMPMMRATFAPTRSASPAPTPFPGSFTAAPLAYAAPLGQPSFVAPAMGVPPVAAPMAFSSQLTRRSWTPAPTAAYPGVEGLGQSLVGMNPVTNSATLQGLATCPNATPTAPPLLGYNSPRPGHKSPVQPPKLPEPPKPAEGVAKEPPSRTAAQTPRPQSVVEPPSMITLNVYWQRKVDYDENRRVQRQLGGDELTWGNKMLKDFLGVYHVGIDVHNTEYTFANYHAPNSRLIGGASSGVVAHNSRKPGPTYVFKQAVSLGKTRLSSQEVENICEQMSKASYTKMSYNRIQHNCVDFAQELSEKLGGAEIPLWCYRGAATARLFGWGLEKDEAAAQRSETRSFAVPTVTPRPPPLPVKPVQPGTPDAAPSTQVVSPAQANAPTPSASQSTGFKFDPSAGTGTNQKDEHGSSTTARGKSGLVPGKRVSVMQKTGQYLQGRLVSEEPDGTYTVQYDSGSKESAVFEARLIGLAETQAAPKEPTTQALPPAPAAPAALPPATPPDQLPPASPFSGLYHMSLGGYYGSYAAAGPCYPSLGGYCHMYPGATITVPSRLPVKSTASILSMRQHAPYAAFMN